ncbi:MAG TPA: TRAP transporter large permease subunit, partial [Burkholderiaceae bacterium]|nr:TRAP transporter large permease subunit [Burkholderiaceae bacterium]
MTDLQVGIAGLVLLIALVAARSPIGISLIAVSYAGVWAIGGHAAAWGMLSVMPHTLIASWTLSSVPMFLLMGFVCYHCRLTNGLFDAAKVWLSRLPGGLAIASVFGCSGFAAITGS